MSSWQNGERILVGYDCEQGFKDTVINKIHVEYKQFLNMYKLRTEVFYKQILFLVEMGKIYHKKCSDGYPHRPLGIANQTDQSY